MASAVLVVGFDGSRAARAALCVAAARARAEDGRLVVVCAHPGVPPERRSAAAQALGAEHEREARAVLDALRADPPAALEGLEVDHVVEAGAPCEALCGVARREDAAAIVIGTHGRGRVSALLGSVAHDLLRASDRPVLVVPPRAVDAVTGDGP